MNISISGFKKKKKPLEINLKSFNSYLILIPLDLGDRPRICPLEKKKKKKKRNNPTLSSRSIHRRVLINENLDHLSGLRVAQKLSAPFVSKEKPQTRCNCRRLYSQPQL